MFSFGNPKILFLLLLIPAMFGLFLLARKARTKKLKRYGRLDVVLGQIPDASRYTPWIKIGVELLLVAVVIVILARPRAKGSSTLTSKMVQGSEIVVAMDISNSMLASSTNDADGISRLQQAKFIVEKLFDRMTNDKVGLVVFAGDAYVQMPITNDFSSAKMFLNSLSTNMVSNQGTAIGAAIETSMGLFSNNPKCQKSIVLITDAENHEDDAIAAAKAAKDKGVEIDVVGVGSSSPMPIPMGGGTYMSFNNQLVRTAFNEQSAQEIAKVGTGVYVSGNNTSAVDILDDQLKKAKKTNMDKKVFSPADEQFPVFAWIALILLVTDILVSEKKISWLTKTNFFGK